MCGQLDMQPELEDESGRTRLSDLTGQKVRLVDQSRSESYLWLSSGDHFRFSPNSESDRGFSTYS